MNSKKVKEFFTLMAIQSLLYLLVVFNIRTIAQGSYVGTGLTDFLIGTFQFFVIKKIASSGDSIHQWAGYSTGGVIGGLLGIYLDTNWFV